MLDQNCDPQPSSHARIVCDDAVAFLRTIDSNSIDLILTSPPYFIGKKYDVSKKWEDFTALIQKIWLEFERIVKSRGSICWQTGYHVTQTSIVPLDILVYNEALKYETLKLRNRIIWTFGHGANTRNRFSGRHETILWYTKGTDHYFDLDSVRVPQKYPGKRHYKGPRKGEWSGNPLGKNPSDVWDIPNVKAGHVEKTKHPCQYPVALATRLIKALCPAGGLVVDPFVGSGSTAVAAVLQGRRFAGSDIDPHYVALSESRVEKALAGALQVRSDGPVREPKPTEKVAQPPPHFSAKVKP